jgi:ribonuclease HI
MNRVAYTDGACSRGFGGWSVVFDDTEYSGSHYPATNNLMELYAIQLALEETPVGAELHVHTDSKLVIGWLAKDWKCTKDYILEVKKAIKAIGEAKDIRLFLHKVKGYNGDSRNERADRLAVQQSQALQYT